MEVGYQRINDFVLIARVDKDLRIAKEGLNQLFFRGLRSALKGTYRRCTDGHDAATARFRRQHRIHNLLRHFGILRVHDVVFDAVHAHRLERPRADVQRHEGHLNTLGAQLFQQRFIKVQARRWRRHCARLLAVDGLIQLAVGFFIRAFNVRRQRHVADGVEDIKHRALVVELHLEQRVVTRGHGRFDALVITQQQFSARLRRFGCANMCQNTFIIEHTFDQHLNLAAAGFTAKQTRWDHAGIVKDQQIARVELVEQIGESTVRQRARWPVQ